MKIRALIFVLFPSSNSNNTFKTCKDYKTTCTILYQKTLNAIGLLLLIGIELEVVFDVINNGDANE